MAIDTFWLLSQKFAEISRRDEDKIKGWLYVVAKNKAWHVLEKKYQCVVQLHYFEGYLAWEVAQILGLKTNTVEQQLSRARKMLKDMLVDE